MPDELYLYREEPLRRGYDPAVVQAAITLAGFTLADVRRLAERVSARDTLDHLAAELAPFASLLKENKGG